MDSSCAERIFGLYDSLKPSTSEDKYTVIATICDSKTGEVLCLATGTAANNRISPDDIEDCHAESLVKRAFKRYCINKLIQILSTCANLEDFRDKLKENLHHEISMFISQFPCGFVRRYQGQEPIDETTGEPIKRKPGRGTMRNGRLIFVEKDCCATKLKRWISCGIQGQRLNQLFGFKSEIKEILIGYCEPPETFDYELHLEGFEHFLSAKDHLKLDLAKNSRRSDLVFGSDKHPQPVGIVWWKSEIDAIKVEGNSKRRKSIATNCEYIVDGRKKGVTKKQTLSDKDIFKLKIGNHHLRKDMKLLEEMYSKLREM